VNTRPLSLGTPAAINRERCAADNAGIRPGSIPAGLSGKQLTAYLEGYAAAAAWTHAGEAFHGSALHSDLQTSFLRGFEARRTDEAKNEPTS
jgi:hypothetical protein